MKVYKLLNEQPMVKPGPTSGSIEHMGKKVGVQPPPYKRERPVTPIAKISYISKNISFLIKHHDLEDISEIAIKAAKELFKDVKGGHSPKQSRDWALQSVTDEHQDDLESIGHDRAQYEAQKGAMEDLFKHLRKEYSGKKDLVNAAVETLQHESPMDFPYEFDEHPRYNELVSKYGKKFIEKFKNNVEEEHTQMAKDNYDSHLWYYHNQLESFLDEIAKRLRS